MVTIGFKRQLQQTDTDYTASLVSGQVSTAAGRVFLPLFLDDFSTPNTAITGASITTGSATITVPAGNADAIRVGDYLTGAILTSFATPADVTIAGCFAGQGLNYVVFPHTVNTSTLAVWAGDVITGTGIPANTVVDKIDYATRRIFLSSNITATDTITVTVTPRVRVIAVRDARATTNPNQFDVSVNATATSATAAVTVVGGAREALHSVVRIEPITNTTGTRVNFTVSVSTLDGREVKGSREGLNGITLPSLSYSTIGTFGFDGDQYLVNARVPRPVTP